MVNWQRCNIDPNEASAVIKMHKQTIETRAWKKNRGVHIDSEKCWLCEKCICHLGVKCLLAMSTWRHNNVSKVLMTTWAVDNGLLQKGQCWCQLKWGPEMVIKNEKVKLCWNFKYWLKKETTAWTPDVIIWYKDRKLTQIIDMVCPSDKNIKEKIKEKLQKYQQLTYKIREWRLGYHVEIIPVVIECME